MRIVEIAWITAWPTHGCGIRLCRCLLLVLDSEFQNRSDGGSGIAISFTFTSLRVRAFHAYAGRVEVLCAVTPYLPGLLRADASIDNRTGSVEGQHRRNYLPLPGVRR